MMSSDYIYSPTLFYPPTPSTQYFPHNNSYFPSYSSSQAPARHMATTNAAVRPSLNTQRSRKRSRDQLDDHERQSALDTSNTMDTTAPAEPEPEPIYGEGMVLLDPRTMRPIGNSASSSTGTWYEQQMEEERRATALAEEQLARDREEMTRALNRPMKAQRLELTGVHAGGSERGGSPTTTPGMIAPAPLTPNTPIMEAPIVDEAAMMLGVGWRKVQGSRDVALVGASKGWARFIDNHFADVSGAEILAKSDGKEAFLVKAKDLRAGDVEGFYLFSERLDEGRLLSHDSEQAVKNLQTGVFEDDGTMQARKTASPELAPSTTTVQPAETAMEL